MYDGKRESSTILTMLRSEADFGSLQSLFPPHWRPIRGGRTLADARRVLNSEPVDIVVTHAGFADGCGWKDVLDVTRSVAGSRPLIVASHCADEFLWAEVLNLGGFDVLNEPFERHEVLWVLDAALRDRRRGATPRRNADVATAPNMAMRRRAQASTVKGPSPG